MFIHYSKKRINHEDLTGKRQKPQPDYKPKGLWISDDGAWKEWCQDESFNLECLAFEADIILKPDAKILTLSSVIDLDAFHDKYKAPILDIPGMKKIFGIKWNEVAKDYQGIVIAPYIWERRLEGEAHTWYYGWDVASGCIWDKDAIQAVRS